RPWPAQGKLQDCRIGHNLDRDKGATAAWPRATRMRFAIAESRHLWPCRRPASGASRNDEGWDMVLQRVAAMVGAISVLAIGTAQAAPLNRNYDAGVPTTNPIASLFGLSASPIARTTVSYPGKYKPGTIVISTSERRLYFTLGNGQALRYGIGVGREGFAWSGVAHVSSKREWPDWTPPEQMLRRRPD